MSSSAVHLDHNYHEILTEEEELEPISDDIQLSEDITEEDITDLINLIEDNTGFDPLSLQLFGFSPEDCK